MFKVSSWRSRYEASVVQCCLPMLLLLKLVRCFLSALSIFNLVARSFDCLTDSSSYCLPWSYAAIADLLPFCGYRAAVKCSEFNVRSYKFLLYLLLFLLRLSATPSILLIFVLNFRIDLWDAKLEIVLSTSYFDCSVTIFFSFLYVSIAWEWSFLWSFSIY